MNVFLTGATGYIGSHVAERLLRAGHRVVGLARDDAAAAKLRGRGIDPSPGNLREPAGLTRAAASADAVVHTAFDHHAADYADGVRLERGVIAALAGALAGSGKPLVVTSGTGLLGDTGEVPVAEDHPVNPNFLLAVRAEAERDALRAAEREVRAVVLRFPLFVYGHGGSVFVPWLFAQARAGGVARYIGDGANKSSAVHVQDAADLYLLALAKAPAGSLYHGAAEHGVTARALAEAVARAGGYNTGSVSREEALALWGPKMVAFLSINNQVDSSKAVRELGWKPRAAPKLLEDVARGSYRQGRSAG